MPVGLAEKDNMSKLVSAEEVIHQIADVLAQADGDFIQYIANEVLGFKVRYVKDSVFEQLENPEVECSICGAPCTAADAHLHQDKWIGDECCWDDRLHGSE